MDQSKRWMLFGREQLSATGNEAAWRSTRDREEDEESIKARLHRNAFRPQYDELALVEIHAIDGSPVELSIARSGNAWKAWVRSAAFTFEQSAATFQGANAAARRFFSSAFQGHACGDCQRWRNPSAIDSMEG